MSFVGEIPDYVIMSFVGGIPYYVIMSFVGGVSDYDSKRIVNKYDFRP